MPLLAAGAPRAPRDAPRSFRYGQASHSQPRPTQRFKGRRCWTACCSASVAVKACTLSCEPLCCRCTSQALFALCTQRGHPPLPYVYRLPLLASSPGSSELHGSAGSWLPFWWRGLFPRTSIGPTTLKVYSLPGAQKNVKQRSFGAAFFFFVFLFSPCDGRRCPDVQPARYRRSHHDRVSGSPFFLAPVPSMLPSRKGRTLCESRQGWLALKRGRVRTTCVQ